MSNKKKKSVGQIQDCDIEKCESQKEFNVAYSVASFVAVFTDQLALTIHVDFTPFFTPLLKNKRNQTVEHIAFMQPESMSIKRGIKHFTTTTSDWQNQVRCYGGLTKMTLS